MVVCLVNAVSLHALWEILAAPMFHLDRIPHGNTTGCGSMQALTKIPSVASHTFLVAHLVKLQGLCNRGLGINLSKVIMSMVVVF